MLERTPVVEWGASLFCKRNHDNLVWSKPPAIIFFPFLNVWTAFSAWPLEAGLKGAWQTPEKLKIAILSKTIVSGRPYFANICRNFSIVILYCNSTNCTLMRPVHPILVFHHICCLFGARSLASLLRSTCFLYVVFIVTMVANCLFKTTIWWCMICPRTPEIYPWRIRPIHYYALCLM